MPDVLQFLRGPGNAFVTGIKAVLSFIGSVAQLFFADILDMAQNIGRIATNVGVTVANIEVFIHEVQDFQLQPHWNSRVIHVPKALQNIKDLIRTLTTEFKDRAIRLRDEFRLFKMTDLAYDPSDNVKAVSKAQNKVTQIAAFIRRVADLTDEISSFSGFLVGIIQRIKSMDDLFLPQGNSRLRQLVDAKRPYIRVGKLQSERGV